MKGACNATFGEPVVGFLVAFWWLGLLIFSFLILVQLVNRRGGVFRSLAFAIEKLTRQLIAVPPFVIMQFCFRQIEAEQLRKYRYPTVLTRICWRRKVTRDTHTWREIYLINTYTWTVIVMLPVCAFLVCIALLSIHCVES